jgi:peptidylprolyl isomerase
MTKRLLVALGLCAVTTACSLDTTSSFNCSVPTLVTDHRGDTVVTVTGLKYIDLETGAGDSIAACRPASVGYVLRLAAQPDSIFDQSASVTVVPGSGSLIPGFEQGVVGMKEGGERLLIVPPQLGYGPNDYRDIPGGSTLLFDITANDAGGPSN